MLTVDTLISKLRITAKNGQKLSPEEIEKFWSRFITEEGGLRFFDFNTIIPLPSDEEPLSDGQPLSIGQLDETDRALAKWWGKHNVKGATFNFNGQDWQVEFKTQGNVPIPVLYELEKRATAQGYALSASFKGGTEFEVYKGYPYETEFMRETFYENGILKQMIYDAFDDEPPVVLEGTIEPACNPVPSDAPLFEKKREQFALKITAGFYSEIADDIVDLFTINDYITEIREELFKDSL